MVFNVRQKQTEVILKLLNFNSSSNKDPGETFKVLVLDRLGKDIIAPLLRVNDLRRHGVTLHLLLEADRQPIPDVPAIYLVQPTPANMDRIVSDASVGLYEAMHLNFTSVMPNRLIEQLASGTVKADCVQRISKVWDQYLGFIALEASLFSLGLPNSYVELNDPTAKDSQIEASITSIVDGLFSVFVTLGSVPIIRCLRGGAAEHVAMGLDARMRDALKSRSNLFTEGVTGLGASLSRPLLCLFDRNFDLSAALQHSWTYKPLVQDVLGMRLNKVAIQEGNPGPSSSAASAAKQQRTYDVDDRDFFWEACGSYAFPRVAEEVETQLKAYRAAVDEINQKTNQGPQEGSYDPDEHLARNTQNLISAVSSLPELQEKKKVLDKHTNLATALLSSIKVRALDQFHNLGEDLLSGKGDLAAVLRLIGPMGRGTAQDKLRLVLIYLLTVEGLPTDSEMADLESAVRIAGGDTTSIQYVRNLKKNNLAGAKKAAPGASQDSLAGLASQSNILDWADKAFGQGLSSVTKTMKALVAGSRQAPVVSVMEALGEGKTGTMEFESYSVFDPKAPTGKVTLERAKGPFKEVMVFMIGGGNYMEREGLMNWAAKSLPPKQLIYGATEILTGDDFSALLAQLGRQSGHQ